MARAGRTEPETNETRDTLFLLGGLSLILFGTGLVLTNPAVRKLLGQNNLSSLLHSTVPDLERYMKLRSM
jgi:LPXTG-motif cell wall-anchored protein